MNSLQGVILGNEQILLEQPIQHLKDIVTVFGMLEVCVEDRQR
jgi:hypothetical protein